MMNYVGSISIIDRGDAPAKAVIDKNARSLAQRVADDTKQELDKVMDRVEVIYDSYETSTQHMFDNPRDSPSVEYIEDIKELEEIIKDTVKKKKYQQQVTVFVVGFQEMCSQRLQLIQQVNQNSKPDDEFEEEKLEVDLDEVANHVNESLNTAEELTKKLSELNQDMIEYLVNYANTKASNKSPSSMLNYDKGKKRLEKNLENARNDASTLSEKLLALQTDLEEKDEKLQQVVKQLELKTQESIRYKTAAEVAKKSVQDTETHTGVLQEEIQKRDEKIQEMRQKLTRLELDLSESMFDRDTSQRRLNDNQSNNQKLEENKETNLDISMTGPEGSIEDTVLAEPVDLDLGGTETQQFQSGLMPAEQEQLDRISTHALLGSVHEHDDKLEVNEEILEGRSLSKQKLQQLKEEVDQKKMAVTDAEREMERLHRDQLANIEQTHNREIDDLRREHKEELRKLTQKDQCTTAT